ncbi:recombinase RecA [Riemerella anatipestifer]|nr:recombinase RecA [Riemerella anatipestifer]
MKIIKNKVAPLFKQAEFDIMYGEGISKTGEILDQALELGIVKKSGSWFSYEDTKLGQGRDAVKEVLRNNPKLAEQFPKLGGTDYVWHNISLLHSQHLFCRIYPFRF